jgi:type IV pilus assembly protein PilB
MAFYIPRPASEEDTEPKEANIPAMGESPDLVSKLLDSMYNSGTKSTLAGKIENENSNANNNDEFENRILNSELNKPIQNNLNSSQASINQSSNNISSNNSTKSTPILDYLFSGGKISADIYKNSQNLIQSNFNSENDYLKIQSDIDEIEIAKTKSALYNIDYVDLTKYNLNGELLHNIPLEIAKKYGVVLFEIKNSANGTDEVYNVAMVDPLDIQTVKFLESQINKKLKVFIAEEGRIRTIIENKYDTDVLIKEDVGKAIEAAEDDSTLKLGEELKGDLDLNSDVANAPVARIVSMILEYGIKFKASDAHIEPREKYLVVRFRVNGLLVEKLTDLPIRLSNPIVARIKILSNLKIDEHRIPQDGRFEVSFAKTKIDIRVSVMPTIYGEKVVLRFLDKTSGVFPLESTGLRGSAYKVYKDSLKQTQGIILVTGPTGSGKTVTLASSIAILNKPDVNIVTLEQPVEIRIDGVNQVQVNPDVGLTFATGLRSFLRQDPDIIMVGEIRDEETSQLATQAALVGRLVLATLHTNSAAGAITRLLNMEVEPFLLSSVLNVIVAQRLPRRICEHCKLEYKASDEQIKMLHTILDGIKGYDLWNFNDPREIPRDKESKKVKTTEKSIKLYKGKGCEYCNDSGYSGRIGIFEVLKVDEKISKLIMQHKSASEIEEEAKASGMISMVQDGFMKALEGITTIEEVLRVQY